MNVRELQIINQIQDKVKIEYLGRFMSLVYADLDIEAKIESVNSFLTGKDINSKYGKKFVYDCAVKIAEDITAFNFANDVERMEQGAPSSYILAC